MREREEGGDGGRGKAGVGFEWMVVLFGFELKEGKRVSRMDLKGAAIVPNVSLLFLLLSR